MLESFVDLRSRVKLRHSRGWTPLLAPAGQLVLGKCKCKHTLVHVPSAPSCAARPS